MSTQQTIGQLSKKPLPEVRASIADEVLDGFDKRTLNPEEFRTIEGIIRLLMRDPEIMVRKRLAYNLQYSAKVPQDIVISLAQDVKEVALPILKNSPLLTEDKLIALIKNIKENKLLMAIATRRSVSMAVVAALINTNIKEVVLSLLMNKEIEISENSYNDIIDFFHQDMQILSLAVERKKLPLQIIRKIFLLLPEDEKRKLCQLYCLDYHELQQGIIPGEEPPFIENTLPVEKGFVENEWLRNQIAQYVNYFYRQGKLTVSTLLRALYEGNILFFEGAVAQLTSLPVATVSVNFRQEKREKFNILCRKAGVPNTMHDALFLLYGFALKHHPQNITTLDELKASKEYKKQLVEYITNSGYDQNIPFMLYIKALVCSQLDKEGLVASLYWGENQMIPAVALTA